MTDFSLTEADRLVQRTAHAFSANEVRPVAQEYDERNEFAWDVATKAAADWPHRRSARRTGRGAWDYRDDHG